MTTTSFNPARVNKTDGDLTKRIIRSINDVVRQLDDARGRAQTIAQLFLPSFEVLRSKLHELCYRLILIDPHCHGKRGEDTLWKKGYHDVFTTAKTLRTGDSWCAEEAAQVRGLLVSGVGYYHHLLLKLGTDYSLPLEQCQDFALHVADYGLSKGKNRAGRLEEAPWATALSVRILICLGDLARYLREIEGGWDPGMAERFYRQAIAVDPGQGRPHNQLGTLAGHRNFGLDAAYHYLRSLNCADPFQGALGNVTNVVDRLILMSDIHKSSVAAKLITALLRAVGSFYCDKSIDMATATSQILEGFRSCVETNTTVLKRPEVIDWSAMSCSTVESSNSLSPNATFKIMAILVMCADKHAGSDQWPLACSLVMPCVAHLVQVLAPRRVGRPRRRRRCRRSSDASDSNSSTNGDSATSQSSDEDVSSSDIGAVSIEDELLQSLNIMLCWLKTHPLALSEYADNQPLLRTLVILLNSIVTQCSECSDCKAPLREDIELRGLLGLRSTHEDLDWSLFPKPPAEESELRANRLILTAQQLPGLQFDSEVREFSVNQIVSGRDKGDLMKHMGQLWLEAEVRDLETRTRRAPPGLSPYLVVDAEALVTHTAIVRHLVGSRQFVLVIPAVVLAVLDDWKRESGRSREAIRWLESQFQRGNRSLRAQKAHERLTLPLMKYPKKKEKDVWNLYQMMECCYYLSKQSSLLVTLLTGTHDSRSPAGVANTFGVSVEQIEAFYSNWKTSNKSSAQTS